MITELMRKPKKPVWPITGDSNNPMNQSEIEKNTWNRRQAREHSGEQVTTPSRFASDWLIKEAQDNFYLEGGTKMN